MELFFTPEIIVSFITLTFLEIVLGVDNLIFIALVVQHLPKRYSKPARIIGLTLALVIRVIMLLMVSWVMSLTKPVLEIIIALSVKDILLIIGGWFLIIKGTLEIRADFKKKAEHKQVKAAQNFISAIAQITFIDFVFSFDSIITAIGITTTIIGTVSLFGLSLPLNISLITGAVVISMIVMLVASGYLAEFLAKYPSFKLLGINFIIFIGAIILAEGFHIHIARGYIYFALVFAIINEIINTLHRKNHAR